MKQTMTLARALKEKSRLVTKLTDLRRLIGEYNSVDVGFRPGFWLALGAAIAGVLCCCTVIGIPFGIACFNIAQASFAPLGKVVAKK